MNKVKLTELSWHRRLWDYVYENPPRSICPYFWGMILAFFAVSFVWIVNNFPETNISIPQPGERVGATLLGLGTIGLGLLFIYQVWWILIIIGLTGAIILGAISLIFVLRDKFEARKFESLQIVAQFTKSKFEKICPMIEWR